MIVWRLVKLEMEVKVIVEFEVGVVGMRGMVGMGVVVMMEVDGK